MDHQLLEASKAIGLNVAAITAAIWGYLKLFLHRADSRIERKKKNIEILDSIVENSPTSLQSRKETILQLSAVEKFNAFYNTKFDFYTIVACLATDNPGETIRIVKNYKKNVKIEGNSIKPCRLFDKNRNGWKYVLYGYILVTMSFSSAVIIFPRISSFGGEVSEPGVFAIRVIYSILIAYLAWELWKLKIAKKYIESIAQQK